MNTPHSIIDILSLPSDSETSIPFKEFLENEPVNSIRLVSNFYTHKDRSYFKEAPILRLHCDSCEGVRNFSGVWNQHNFIKKDTLNLDYLVYKCKDCGSDFKWFSIMSITMLGGNGAVHKVGEVPESHIDLPSNLPSLLGEDYTTFIKGLKCEKQGLGIGAFSYYRRVVENNKSRLILKISEVAKKIGAEPEAIETLEKASTETQFTNAIKTVKKAIPETLLVDGHNPLQLLHTALSIGLHESSDAKCLEVSHSIRTVLTNLAEKMQFALREQAGLKDALKNLLQFEAEKKKSKKVPSTKES